MTDAEIDRRVEVLARDDDGAWRSAKHGTILALIREAILRERDACVSVCDKMVVAHQKYGDACSGQKTDLDTDSKAFYYQLGKYDAAMLLRIELQKRT